MSYVEQLIAAFGAGNQPKNGLGLYMVTLKSERMIPGIVPEYRGIIYVGKSQNLKRRDHMSAPTSKCTSAGRSLC